MRRCFVVGIAALMVAAFATDGMSQPTDKRAPGMSRPVGGKPGGGHENPSHGGGGKPSPERPKPERPNPGKPNPGRPTPGRPGPGKPNPGGPSPGRPGPGGHHGGAGKPQPGRPGIGSPRPQPSRPRPPVAARPPHRYPLGAYRRPPGYYSRQWSIGLILPSLFRSQTYWLGSYAQYGLSAPPPGTRWVRVDDDALLVSNRTGRVIQVVHDVFY